MAVKLPFFEISRAELPFVLKSKTLVLVTRSVSTMWFRFHRKCKKTQTKHYSKQGRLNCKFWMQHVEGN